MRFKIELPKGPVKLRRDVHKPTRAIKDRKKHARKNECRRPVKGDGSDLLQAA